MYNPAITLIFRICIITLCFCVQIAVAKHSTNKKHQKKPKITGIISSKRIKLSGLDFERALSTNTQLVTEPIAQTCIYSSQNNKFFYLVISTGKKNILDNDFALFSRKLGKIRVSVQIHSANDINPITMLPDHDTLLKNHGDHLAYDKNCTNPVFLNLVIQPHELRKAFAGTYKISINLFALEYDG